MNTHLRDNLNAINSNPSARATRPTAQSFANGVEAVLGLDTTDWSQGGITRSGSQLIVDRAGKYLAIASIGWVAAVSAGFILKIVANSPTNPVAINNANADMRGVQCQVIINLATGNYVEVRAQQNSGAAMDGSGWLELQRLSD